MDEHYCDRRLAEIYDLDNPWAADSEFYVALAGTEPLRILDLGCGTGLLACALAARGHHVAGVDPAAAMLAVARAKPHAGDVEWIEAFAQSFVSASRFDLIVMTGHAFQCLLTDAAIRDTFGVMRRHLATGGRIAFETRNPDVDWVDLWTASVPHLRVSGWRGELLSFERDYHFTDGAVTSRSTLRFPPLAHVTILLQEAGFILRDVYGDWESRPFAPGDREMIFVAAV